MAFFAQPIGKSCRQQRLRSGRRALSVSVLCANVMAAIFIASAHSLCATKTFAPG